MLGQVYHSDCDESSVSLKMRQIGGRCISLMNNQEKNSYVKAQLLKALLNMMKKMPFGEITVSSLVQTAGVGRASFYRNYKSVEDVLLQEAKRVTEEWKREYDSVEHTQPNELLVSLLDFYKAYDEFFLSIYGAGQQQIVLDMLLTQIPILPEAENAVAYVQSAFAYMIYGWIHEWMKRGMQESGTELVKIFEEAQKNRQASPYAKMP